MTSPPPPPARLSELPPELRNRIYELVLIKPYRIPIVKGQSEDPSRLLLSVCRQVYQEAASMYYSANRFGFHYASSDIVQSRSSVNSLISWCKQIGGKHRALVSDIRIWLDDPDSFSLSERFESLCSLNSMLAREAVWLPATVLRVRVEFEYLNQCEMAILTEADTFNDDDEHDCWRPKNPSIRSWRRREEDEDTDAEEDSENPMLCSMCSANKPTRKSQRSSEPAMLAPFLKITAGSDLAFDGDALDTIDSDEVLNEPYDQTRNYATRRATTHSPTEYQKGI